MRHIATIHIRGGLAVSLAVLILLLTTRTLNAEYVRVGPAKAHYSFLFTYRNEEVDAYEIRGTMYRIPTRFADVYIDETRGKPPEQRCWTRAVDGSNFYFKGERVGGPPEYLVFKCVKR